MRLSHIALAAAGVLLVAAGHDDARAGRDRIEGSGRLETRTLDLEAFDAVELGGAFDVTITFGEQQRVEATLDDNLFDNLEAEVSGGELRLGWDKNCDASNDCEFRITMVALREFSLHGAGDVEIAGYAGDRLELNLRGAGDMELDGEVGHLEIGLQGAGDIDARDLKAEHVEISLSGVGDCEVYASVSIDARLSGVGDLKYWGNPEHRKTKVTGIGDIKAK